MEIERKYLVASLPKDLAQYPFHLIEQAYLCTKPVVRIRRQDAEYILTYKGKGLMVREEYNLPLTEEAYRHLLAKADGTILTKKRYLIPLSGNLKAELDIFGGAFDGLKLVEVEFPSEESKLVEVEFPSEESANSFVPPSWFGEDVTFSSAYHNSTLSTADPAAWMSSFSR